MANNSWSNVVHKFLDVYDKKPWATITLVGLVVVLATVGGYIYLTHQPKVLPSVEVIGNKNQTSGTNDGTMKQINK